MTVLFLDIDGVLNHNPHYPVYDRPQLFPELVKRLDGILEVTDARVVLTTNWKSLIPVDRVFAHLKEAGLREQLVDHASATPYRPTRGEEVAAWLFSRDYSGPYVILDDRSDYTPGQPLIRTNPSVGLTGGEAALACHILLGQPQFAPLTEVDQAWVDEELKKVNA